MSVKKSRERLRRTLVKSFLHFHFYMQFYFNERLLFMLGKVNHYNRPARLKLITFVMLRNQVATIILFSSKIAADCLFN